eukprot:gnl/Hemi2/1858_TR659_c0_g1_i1.p2 gnl/Hemi2/1858_TR659_c0_g1~~gnl/Hemi2/1858_TR659_c0_g1_i1.p2  ORF type:complete len:127 (+),score=12.74 gnl/Hemi2/1858_TR659_c0_g1_i1:228-608(+)
MALYTVLVSGEVRKLDFAHYFSVVDQQGTSWCQDCGEPDKADTEPHCIVKIWSLQREKADREQQKELSRAQKWRRSLSVPTTEWPCLPQRTTNKRRPEWQSVELRDVSGLAAHHRRLASHENAAKA